MDFIKSAMLILVGVAMVWAVAWLMPSRVAPEEGAEVARKLAEVEQRVHRLERSSTDLASPAHAGASVELEQLKNDIARLQGQVSALEHSRTAPGVAASPGQQARAPTGMPQVSMGGGPRPPAASLEPRQLERVVAEVVASLAPAYVEEQVRQLYAAQKKADEETQREAEQRRAQEVRERRLAQLVTDLQTFVPGLRPFQVEEVAQVISEQWDAMAALRQQARENGTLAGPGEILRRAREMTDERLEAILSPPQLEAFRLWRETRFGAPESMVR